MGEQTHEDTAKHARSRDPTLSQTQSLMVATVFGARVCGTDGEGCESLSEFLMRTEKNEMFLNKKLEVLVDRVGKLEATCASLLRRKERLRLSP